MMKPEAKARPKRPSGPFPDDKEKETCEGTLLRYEKLRLKQQGLNAAWVETHGPNNRAAIKALTVIPNPLVSNVMELVALFQFELYCLVGDFSKAKGFRRSFYARLIILCVYESSRTMRELLGKQLRTHLTQTLGPELDARIKSVNKISSDLFEDVNSAFGDVRHGLLGHRDPDAKLRYALLSKVKEDEALDMAWRARDVLIALTAINHEYLDHCLARLDIAMRDLGIG